MMKRTKIVATLGPATDDESMLEKLLLAGTDVVRVNFSHGGAESVIKRVESVRKIAKKHELEIGILGDLQGPKIRIAKFKEGKIFLNPGEEFCLDAEFDDNAGDKHCVGIDYKSLPKDVFSGDALMLDDGRIMLTVKEVQGPKIVCEVICGGVLSNNKGINRRGGGLSAGALTDKDREDIKTAVALDLDFLAVSFPRSAEDIHETRALLKRHNGVGISIISKIERTEAVQNIEEIIVASDGVMVARGDLAIEIGDAEVPAVQKQIIHLARNLDKPVITATQMMESMIEQTVPTRAEVSDVANAVLDGTDAVMLSAETAVGKHPNLVIQSMVRICQSAEKSPRSQRSRHRLETEFERVDEAIAMATMYTANHLKIRAIISLTESGATPLWMSRIRSGIPIYGLSRLKKTRAKMTLFRGVYPINFDVTKLNRDEVNKLAVNELEKRDLVKQGDFVIITKGDHMGVLGGTNAMKIITVGSDV